MQWKKEDLKWWIQNQGYRDGLYKKCHKNVGNSFETDKIRKWVENVRMTKMSEKNPNFRKHPGQEMGPKCQRIQSIFDKNVV